MEKAMGAPFNLRSTTEQFKEFFQKVSQTSQQSFSLVSGLSKAVEAKVDFAGFRAAVPVYIYAGVPRSHSLPAYAAFRFSLPCPTTTGEKKSGACYQNITIAAGIKSSLGCSTAFQNS